MAGPVAEQSIPGVIFAPSFNENVYQGAHGNESVVEGFAELNAVAANTEVRLLRLPVGMRINSVQLVTGDLGAGVTVTVKSGAHELVHADDVHVKVAHHFVIEPYSTRADGELITVVIGGAAATGKINVLVRYQVVGY
ncbi:TPA: hypothetical protein MND73_004287 [Salmonella enterica subsp. houtenae]|nr:hypothetical protein [Salmonella enterica subsp. houtenae]